LRDDFDARFNAVYRHYKYVFTLNGVSKYKLAEMNEIIKKFEGRHDFRNYCKEDNSVDCNRII